MGVEFVFTGDPLTCRHAWVLSTLSCASKTVSLSRGLVQCINADFKGVEGGTDVDANRQKLLDTYESVLKSVVANKVRRRRMAGLWARGSSHAVRVLSTAAAPRPACTCVYTFFIARWGVWLAGLHICLRTFHVIVS